jgi:WhiB family transcriptional regulator, redox-sensing transcriptional regulator
MTIGQIARLPWPVFSSYEWQQGGACAQADPTLFFHPEGERGPARQQRDDRALAVCAECPVLAACRTHAISVQEPYGVWGGTTETEREAIHVDSRRGRRRMAETG